MEDPNHSGLFKMLGELSADMKHVLRSLESNKRETVHLREEMRLEHDKLKARLSSVEKFNVRVLTVAALATPVLLAVVKWGVPAVLTLLV